jgi:hypothetical protein
MTLYNALLGPMIRTIIPHGNPARAERDYHFIESTHGHTTIMAKTEQIDAAARGILNVSAHAGAWQSGVPTQFRSRGTNPARQRLQTSEGMFKQKELS